MTTETVDTTERAVPDGEEGMLRLRPGLHVLPHGDDEVFVREGSRSAFSKIVRDPQRRRVLAKVVQAMTEPMTAGVVAEQVQAAEVDVREILHQLLEADVLQRLEVSPRTAMSIALIGDGELGDSLAANLASGDAVKVERIPADTDHVQSEEAMAVFEGSDLVIVATDYLQPGLNLMINQRIHDADVPALFSHIDGTEIVVGPLTLPGQSSCYLCFDVQDEGARHLRDEYLIYKDNLRTNQPIGRVQPAVAKLAAGWVNLAVNKFDPQSPDFLVNRVLRVETSKMEVMTHRILQIPRCPVCSHRRPDLQHTFL